MGLRLLPAEKVELRLRPSPWAWLGRYARSLSWLAWGALLAALLAPTWGAGPGWWRVLAAAQAAAAGPLLVAAVLERARHSWRLPAAIVAADLAAIAAALTLTVGAGLAFPWALAASFGAVAAGATAWTEARRATTWLWVTNLRLVGTQRWPRREQQVLHTDLTDLDARQGPLARRLDVATLVAVRPDGIVAFQGVRPAARVRRLVQVLVRRATATEYLREHQGLDAQVADAMAALQRR